MVFSSFEFVSLIMGLIAFILFGQQYFLTFELFCMQKQLSIPYCRHKLNKRNRVNLTAGSHKWHLLVWDSMLGLGPLLIALFLKDVCEVRNLSLFFNNLKQGGLELALSVGSARPWRQCGCRKGQENIWKKLALGQKFRLIQAYQKWLVVFFRGWVWVICAWYVSV